MRWRAIHFGSVVLVLAMAGLLGREDLHAQTPATTATTAVAKNTGTAIAVASKEMSPEMDDAVSRGLAFLVKNQGSDGSIDGGAPPVATTGLAVMAMLASGQVADEGRFGVTVRTAVDFLTRQVPDDGYVGKVDGSRMYGQGIVTLALAEASGVETDQLRLRRMRGALSRLVGVIEKAQDVAKDGPIAGGWRYEPQSSDSDLSVTGWCVQALCAAGNTGLEVDKARVARAAGFVMSCYRADSGGFAYQPGGDATTSMTGAGVLSLMLLNRGPSDISSPGTGTAATTGWRYMVENPVGDGTDMPYYAMYYSTAAAYQAGGSAMLTAGGSAMLTTGGSTALTAGGSTWPAVWSKTSARLMSMRDKDGGWQVSPSGQEPGRVYATAMAVLTMSMPYRVLPMYQR